MLNKFVSFYLKKYKNWILNWSDYNWNKCVYLLQIIVVVIHKQAEIVLYFSELTNPFSALKKLLS